MSVEQISAVSGLVLSLIFEYVPGISALYDKLDKTAKQLVMLALLALVVVAAFLLSCFGPFKYFTCDSAGIWSAINAFIAALVANQATHRIAPKR
jgi:hypothetical protein